MTAKSLIQFETPKEGVKVKCECGNTSFTLALHSRLDGTMITRTATCTACGHTESIDP